MSKSGTRARDLVSGRSVSGLAITKYSQLSAKARALDRSLFPLFRGTIKGEITKVITNSMCDGLYTKAVYLLYMHLGMSTLKKKTDALEALFDMQNGYKGNPEDFQTKFIAAALLVLNSCRLHRALSG